MKEIEIKQTLFFKVKVSDDDYKSDCLQENINLHPQALLDDAELVDITCVVLEEQDYIPTISKEMTDDNFVSFQDDFYNLLEKYGVSSIDCEHERFSAILDLRNEVAGFIEQELNKKGKTEMINEILSLCNANKDNSNCSIYWLADQIKEIVEGKSYLGDLQEVNDEKI